MLKTGKEAEYDIRKRFIIDAVRLYEARWPEEAKEAKASVQAMKDTRANVFGADKAMEMRFALRLPTRLYDILSKLDNPSFLHEKEELVWFIKNFPGYSVTQKT